MKYMKEAFRPIVAFSLLALLDTQSVFAQNGLTVNSANPKITSISNVDNGSLLRIDATQDLNITINDGSGNAILSKKSGSGVAQGIIISGRGATNLKITSNTQQSIIINANGFDMYNTVFENSSNVALTFGVGVSLVVNGNGGTVSTASDFYGINFGGRAWLDYRFGSGGVVFEQVGSESKNTVSNGAGSNATGIRVESIARIFGKLTFSKIVGGQGGDGESGVGGRAYGITGTGNGKTLHIREGAKIIFDEIVGGDGGGSNGSIVGSGGEAGGIFLASGELKIWAGAVQNLSAINALGRIVFKSISGGKSKDNASANIYPINNKGTLELQGISIVVGEESEENKTNYYGIHNKVENTQYIFGRTVLKGFEYLYGRAPDLVGLVLDKSARMSGEVEVRGGVSGEDWQAVYDGANVVGLVLRNSKITAINNGFRVKVAGGHGGYGGPANSIKGKNGDATGIKTLENSSIEGNLTIDLIDVYEGSGSYALDQFNMIDNYGILSVSPNSIIQVNFATSQVARYKTRIAINNSDTITLGSGSAIRMGSNGSAITSGIYNYVGSKTIYNIGHIDIEGNSVQSSTTGFVTRSDVQINGANGLFNVYAGENKPIAGFAFIGGVSSALDVVANIYGSQGQPIVGIVLDGNAELNASNMTLNLSTKQNARLSRAGDEYFAGIVLSNGSAKIASGIYTFNFPDKASTGDKIFAIKNLSTNGTLTLSSQAFIPLGITNPSEVAQISILQDNVGYSYEFGSGGAKTILDAGYLPNGLFFTKTIQASGNLEIQGSDERINALTARINGKVGIVSDTPLSVSVKGKQAKADNGADVGRSVGINVAQGEFFLQGKNGGEIVFNINGGRDKEAQNIIGEAVGVIISGDAFSADEFSSFKIIGGEAYGVKLVGSSLRSRKITLNLNEANFKGSSATDGAIVGSEASYGIYNQGNTRIEGSAVFGDGSCASIGSSSSKQAYGLYNQSGTLNIVGNLQFKTNSILAKSGGESGVIYNAGEIIFAKNASLVAGDTPNSGTQSNLQANDTTMKIKMLEGSSMLFSDVAFSTQGIGKIDIDMGYDLASKKGAKLLFEDNAGNLNTLNGKYAQISLAGANQSSINTRKKEVFAPRTLTIADMQLDKSSFILFAGSKDSINNQSDQVIITGSTLNSLVDNSLHIVLGDFRQEAQNPTILAEVSSGVKDSVIFNGLLQDGERANTTTYSGFDTAVIEVERVSDANGNAIYQSTLEVKEKAVNGDYINPTAAVLSTNFNLFSANLNSLNKRMGELRDNPFTHGAWARIFVGKQSSDFGVEATSIYTTLQAGYDYKFRFSDSNNYAGLALSYINSSTNQALSRYRIDNLGNVMLGISSATTNGVELALYNSYIADSGLYSDSVMKISYLVSDVDMFEQSRNYTTKNVGFSLSQEVGYRFRIGKNTEWMIDPQAELSYGYFNAEDFVQVLDGLSQSYLDSKQDAISLLRSRAGVAFGYDFSHLIKKEGYKTSAYLGMYYIYDYLAGGDVSYLTNNNSQASYQAMKSNGRFALNIGANAELEKNIRLYFDFEKSFGNVMRIEYQFNFGVRIGLGSDEVREESKKEQEVILKPSTLQSKKTKDTEQKKKNS